MSRSALGVPHERVPRTVQDLSAAGTNRHDCGQDRGVKSVTRQSREEPAVDCDRAHLRVVTAEVDVLCTDLGLNASHGRLGKGDESLWMEAETGEAKTVHCKRIARHIGPFGVGLKGRLAPLLCRRRRT